MQEIKGMHASSKEHSEEAKALESRFSRYRTISGTQKQHCMKPVSKDTIWWSEASHLAQLYNVRK